jgi:thiamine-phosphate pyrophosphorylase
LKKADKFVLCYVTERRSLRVEQGQNRETALVQRIEKAVRAGVDWVQIREKDLSARDMVGLTRAAIKASKTAPARSDARILVNDRLDVAWAAGAGGVHAGEKSLPLRVLMDARSTTASANFLVGASCHSLEGAIDANEAGADYLFFGPVFETPSKVSYGPPQGLAKLGHVCSAVSIPVIAIGGITVENATACRKAGAGGIAAIRLFQHDCDIAEIVAALAGE